ncbi:Aste57867_319 [Aphanomyces stellatus]|uniref:Aste57867_319 protein n=1 Tax=Aphanomyces stellatus TaxID=120398 RepID=A0A485K3G6_9STRA|nr:hypothetical protein As57867_000319 [Aphanomyces stellatus]VFT77545.1 Aste57867_319 [Aphanomyces stellatus]
MQHIHFLGPDFGRDGYVHKKGSKRGVFGRANWKRRYMILLGTKLHYYTEDKKTLKGTVDLSQSKMEDIVRMPRDCFKTGRSDASVWRVCVQTPDRRFYFAANSIDDMDGWVRALRFVVQKQWYCPSPIAFRNADLEERLEYRPLEDRTMQGYEAIDIST